MRLTTFGRAYITRHDGEELALQPLPVAVLAYLAVGGPRDRDHLAELFWPNSKNALNSLSTTLNRIRDHVPDGVWIRGGNVVGTDLVSDVGDVRDAIDRSDVDSAVALYRAPFLESLKLRRQSPEFEEWVLEVRANLASTVEMALLQRSQELSTAGEHKAAAVAAERAWEIAIRDSFPSPDYFETYHRLLASTARPSANAVRAMAEDFGMALPTVEPIVLESSGESTALGDPTSQTLTGDHPIGSTTQLFGCEEELDAIGSSVGSQRLTTVIGLGGGGKTRLATEFFNSARAARDFALRYWVNLREVTDDALVGPAIATSLGQRFVDMTSLADGLPEREPVLLVLDNFEHLLSAAETVDELVRIDRDLHVLVTSRVPLDLAAESLVHLDGLDTSDQGVASPAELLFDASARRAGVGDDRLSGMARRTVREVCRRVGGNPLALEIVGGWAQILSPAEMLDALSVGNELLDSPMVGDLRSMDAVLRQSWSALAEAEQETLMLLATFRGGCLTREALNLQELSVRSVRRLVQYSLARQHVEGRITLHPLIAEHALSELERRPDSHRDYHRVLCEWCERFAATARSNSNDTHSQTFDGEIATFTGAWLWAAQEGHWQLHRATMMDLRQFFTESGRVSEGRALFAAVADALRSDSNAPQRLLAGVLEAVGWFHVLSGDSSQARLLLDQALAAGPDDDPIGRARILRSLGVLQLSNGEIDDATANFNEGLDLVADESGPLTAALQFDVAQAHHYRGARDQAKAAARSALKAGRSVNDVEVMTSSYLLLAAIEVEVDPERAIVLLNEGWVIAKESSLDSLAIYFPHALGLAYLNLGKADLAESHFAEGLLAANEIGQLPMVCANHVGRAEASLLLDRTAEAIDDLRTAIRLALKTGTGRYLMWAAVVSCRAAAARHGPTPLASELLHRTLRHPATDQEARDKAIEALQDLFGAAPQPASDPVDESVSGELDEMAEWSLQLLDQW